MAIQTITYTDKVYLNENVDIPAINKVRDVDMNEIKSVVNNNADIVQDIIDAEVYSTSEVKTNKVWVNNKPIYRKIVFLNTNLTNGNKISLTGIDKDELIRINAIHKKNSNNYVYYDSYYDSSSDKVNLHYRPANDDIEVWTGSGVNYTSTIWIEYTKTTD